MRSAGCFSFALLAGAMFAMTQGLADNTLLCDPIEHGKDADWQDTLSNPSNYKFRGVCHPNYGFGTVPLIYDEVQDSSDTGTEAATGNVNIPLQYVYNGQPYDLLGAWVWFELGAWNYDNYIGWYWDKYAESDWCYIEAGPGRCFVAGTPVATLDGSKPIELVTKGDYVMTRPVDAYGDSKPVAGGVREVVRSRAKTLNITVGGHTVRSTSEHPFYVRDKGWTPASQIKLGDCLGSGIGRWMPVESIAEAGEASVYNLRVENDSYFIGGTDWGFAIWVYGACRKQDEPVLPFAIATSKSRIGSGSVVLWK